MLRTSWHIALLFVVSLALPAPSAAQSQAANGVIEGTIGDVSGGVLPGVTVTLNNLDTGAERTVVTNESGLYRAPLLPLGTYRVVAELQGFKKFEQTGVVVSAGATVTVNVTLTVGAVSETVTVNAADAPPLDLARIDVGHNISGTEIKNLPLVARNPYNFALVQPAVSGFENPEFGVPRISANGTLLRVNYQIDGNTNTEKDRAGLRLLPVSEVMVSEVKVVTSGFAPEFGQTTGMVYNAITPSGTNRVHGDATYLFRRKNFSAFPFPFTRPKTPQNKPDTKVDTLTGTLGGPLVKSKLLYYLGFERTPRDISASRVITIKADDAAAIGLKAQPAVVPAKQTGKFFIGKADYQVSGSNHLTGRYLLFRNDSPYNSGGALNSLEQATDFLDAMNSTAGQLVTTFGNSALNELRVQYANRHQSSALNSDSGKGPAVVISNVATFGSPLTGSGQGNAGFDFKQGIVQTIDNFTYLRGDHSYKLGFDWQHVHDVRTSAAVQSYTFGTIAAYLAAKSGANPFAYSSFTQRIGDLSFSMDTNLYGLFVQDDWQVAQNVKLLYGLRYDVYRYPDGRPDAPFSYSQKFNVDTNNVGPRAGVAWTLNPRTVVRASTGIMYDQPILVAYESALQLNGSPKVLSVSLNPQSAGAPPFPSTLSNLPPGFAPPAQPSIFAVDPSFSVARTWQSNLQVERALARDFTAAIGLVYNRGSQLPVLTDINVINPVATLADGRNVYSTAVSAATRMDSRFNHIYTVQSLGDSTYKAFTLQLGKRFSRGTVVNVSYTLGKGNDDAPMPGGVLGAPSMAVASDDPRSDPQDLERDRGPNLLDMRHNFTGSVVLNPTRAYANAVLSSLLNNNQLAMLLQFNSGLPFNIRGNQDLNKDGLSNDRPLFVGRNTLYLPNRYNVDLRYSRFVSVKNGMRGEVIAEFKNVFNTDQIAGVSAGIATDAAGNPARTVPTDASGFPVSSGYEQREFQLGFRFKF